MTWASTSLRNCFSAASCSRSRRRWLGGLLVLYALSFRSPLAFGAADKALRGGVPVSDRADEVSGGFGDLVRFLLSQPVEDFNLLADGFLGILARQLAGHGDGDAVIDQLLLQRRGQGGGVERGE